MLCSRNPELTYKDLSVPAEVVLTVRAMCVGPVDTVGAGWPRPLLLLHVLRHQALHLGAETQGKGPRRVGTNHVKLWGPCDPAVTSSQRKGHSTSQPWKTFCSGAVINCSWQGIGPPRPQLGFCNTVFRLTVYK